MARSFLLSDAARHCNAWASSRLTTSRSGASKPLIDGLIGASGLPLMDAITTLSRCELLPTGAEVSLFLSPVEASEKPPTSRARLVILLN